MGSRLSGTISSILSSIVFSITPKVSKRPIDSFNRHTVQANGNAANVVILMHMVMHVEQNEPFPKTPLRNLEDSKNAARLTSRCIYKRGNLCYKVVKLGSSSVECQMCVCKEEQ